MQEEDRLKHDRIESANLVSTSKTKGIKRKANEATKGPDQKKPIQNKDMCFFCKKTRHQKKICTKYHAWCAKKGILLTLVYSKVNLALVPKNT